MITMLNTDSNKKQVVVLEKAWKYLESNNKLTPADKLLVENYGKSNFTNLAHYFHYLPELINHNPLYLMLPSDEQPFIIDANTREIQVPKDFEKCGGVQSDNYSEIATFIIDRYFDYKDLAEARIAVQWINEAAHKEGVSFIDLIDLETYGDENKLRFGWPLTAEMTAAAGNLRFAVRFYTATEKDNALEFNYILNTAPKSILIKPTLSVDFTDTNVIKNNADVSFFLNTITRSQNPSYAIPSQVIFSDVPEDVARIRLTDNKLALEAEAYTSDGNHIIYDWYYVAPGYRPYIPYNEDGSVGEWPTKRPATKFYVKNINYVEGSVKPEEKDQYLEFTEVWPETKPNEDVLVLYVLNPVRKIQDNDDFTIETDYNEYNPTPWPVERPLGLSFWVKDDSVQPGGYRKYGWNEPWPVFVETPEEKEELENEDGKEVLTTLDITLYTYKSVLKFEDTQTDVTGAYFVRGTNQVTDFDGVTVINSVHTDAPANYCSILSPVEVKIEEGKDLPNHMFLTNESNTLEITINKDDADPQRFYNLYYSNTQFSDIENIPENDLDLGIITEITELNPVTNNSTTIVYDISEGQFGYYAIKPIVKLNRVTDDKQISNICYVSGLPVEVSGTMCINNKSIDTSATSGTTDDGINFTWLETQAGEQVDYDTVMLGDFGNLDFGTRMTLSVTPIINDDTEKGFKTGDITYKWTRQAPDELSEEVTGNNLSGDGDIIELTEDGKLTVQVIKPDNLQGYAYSCQIFNTIEDESKESKVFTFIIK